MSYRTLETLAAVPNQALETAIPLKGICETNRINDIVASIFCRWRKKRKNI